jgi:hypothetical protein
MLMKRLLLLAGMLVAAAKGFAQEGHRLIIYSEDSARFTVAVNELEEQSVPVARAEIAGIAEDRPEVLIRFADSGIPPVQVGKLKIGDPRAANNPSYTAVYALRRSGNRYRLRLVSRTMHTYRHGVWVEEGMDGTRVEISSPGRVRIRTHR